MSERRKLEEEFLNKHNQRLTMSDFIIAWGKLVENCKHDNAHWIMEISSDGVFSDALVKRCYVCGVNIDSLEAEKKFVDGILKRFDTACELEKLKQEKHVEGVKKE